MKSAELAVMTCGFCLLGLANLVSSSGGRARAVRYEHFDDYLLSIGNTIYGEQSTDPRPHLRLHTGQIEDEPITLESESPASPRAGPGLHKDADDASSEMEEMTEPESTLDILGYFRDMPRDHWSCCMLGMLAGDKGFHCQAQFYAARIVMRNRNRAHNRRMRFHGRDRVPNWGKDIMFHFRRCVEDRRAEFHKCCFAANVERAEIAKWRRLQRSHEISDDEPTDY